MITIAAAVRPIQISFTKKLKLHLEKEKMGKNEGQREYKGERLKKFSYKRDYKNAFHIGLHDRWQ